VRKGELTDPETKRYHLFGEISMNQITIEFPPETVARLEELATEQSLPVQDYVRLMVMERIGTGRPAKLKRRPGSAAGVIVLAPDSDAPHLPETLAHFGL
jgi:hypothetical protein